MSGSVCSPGTPLPAELGLRPGRRVLLAGAPDGTWSGPKLARRLRGR